jgi:hypothetical protein
MTYSLIEALTAVTVGVFSPRRPATRPCPDHPERRRYEDAEPRVAQRWTGERRPHGDRVR